KTKIPRCGTLLFRLSRECPEPISAKKGRPSPKLDHNVCEQKLLVKRRISASQSASPDAPI
ncbi:MAG: hypothetical protein L0226_11725, partial [Acidobacteria bacterium]|nr:hypothetical protein [Acidobacteriota bacterium]